MKGLAAVNQLNSIIGSGASLAQIKERLKYLSQTDADFADYLNVTYGGIKSFDTLLSGANTVADLSTALQSGDTLAEGIGNISVQPGISSLGPVGEKVAEALPYLGMGLSVYDAAKNGMNYGNMSGAITSGVGIGAGASAGAGAAMVNVPMWGKVIESGMHFLSGGKIGGKSKPKFYGPERTKDWTAIQGDDGKYYIYANPYGTPPTNPMEHISSEGSKYGKMFMYDPETNELYYPTYTDETRNDFSESGVEEYRAFSGWHKAAVVQKDGKLYIKEGPYGRSDYFDLEGIQDSFLRTTQKYTPTGYVDSDPIRNPTSTSDQTGNDSGNGNPVTPPGNANPFLNNGNPSNNDGLVNTHGFTSSDPNPSGPVYGDDSQPVGNNDSGNTNPFLNNNTGGAFDTSTTPSSGGNNMSFFGTNTDSSVSIPNASPVEQALWDAILGQINLSGQVKGYTDSATAAGDEYQATNNRLSQEWQDFEEYYRGESQGMRDRLSTGADENISLIDDYMAGIPKMNVTLPDGSAIPMAPGAHGKYISDIAKSRAGILDNLTQTEGSLLGNEGNLTGSSLANQATLASKGFDAANVTADRQNYPMQLALNMLTKMQNERTGQRSQSTTTTPSTASLIGSGASAVSTILPGVQRIIQNWPTGFDSGMPANYDPSYVFEPPVPGYYD